MNIFEEKGKPTIEILKISKQVERDQLKALKGIKRERNNKEVKKTLRELRKAAADGSNLMPRILDCVRAYATLGEMCGTLKEEFGEYHEPIIF